MEAKDVQPVVWKTSNDLTFELYFVDERYERSFINFGQVYRQTTAQLLKHYADRTRTVSVCIMPDGSHGEIKDDHIDDVRTSIALLRDALAEREQAAESVFDAIIDMFAKALAADISKQGHPDPDGDCKKCLATLCPLNENRSGASPA